MAIEPITVQPVQPVTPLTPEQEAALKWAQDNGWDPNKGEFSKGVSAGIDSLQSIGYGALGFIGDVVGSESLRKVGARGMQRNMAQAALNAPTVQEFGDIKDISDAGKYIAYNTGQILPSVAESLGVAALGAVTGGPVGALTGAVGKQMVKKALIDNLSDAAATKAKRAAGATLLNAYGTGVGDIYQEISQGGQVDPNAALAAGAAVPYAGLEYLADINLARMVGIGKVMDNATADISRSLLKTSVTKGVRQAGLEGVTEAGQEGVLTGAAEIQDPESMSLEVATDRMINSFFSAAAGSLIPGMAGGAVHHFQNRAPAAPVAETEQSAEQPAYTSGAADIEAGQTNDYNEARRRYVSTEGATTAPDYAAEYESSLKGVTANFPDPDQAEVVHSFNRYMMDTTNDPNAPYSDTRGFREVVPPREQDVASAEPFVVHIPLNENRQFVGTNEIGATEVSKVFNKSMVTKAGGVITADGNIAFKSPEAAAAFAAKQNLPDTAIVGGSGANTGQAQIIAQNSEQRPNGDWVFTHPVSGRQYTIAPDRFEAIAAEAAAQADDAPTLQAARNAYATLKGTPAQKQPTKQQQAKAAKVAEDTAHEAGTVAAIAAIPAFDPTFANDPKKAESIARRVAKAMKTRTGTADQNNYIVTTFRKEDERNAAFAARDAYVKAQSEPQTQPAPTQKEPKNEKAAKQEKAADAKPKETADAKPKETADVQQEAAGDGQPVSKPEGVKKQDSLKKDIKAAEKQAEKELAEKEALRVERNKRREDEARKKTKVLADHFEAMQNGVSVPLKDGKVEVRYNIGVQTFKRVFDSDAKLRATLQDTATILKESGVRQTTGFIMPKTEQEMLNKKRDEAIASVAAAKEIFPYLKAVEKPRAVVETIPVKDDEGNLVETQTVKTEGDLYAPLLDAVRVFIEADVGSKEFIDSLSLIVEVAEGKLTEKDVASSSEIKAAKSFIADPNITKIPNFESYMEDARELADKRVKVSEQLDTEQQKRAEFEKRTKEYIGLMAEAEARAIMARENLTKVTGQILDRAKEDVTPAARERAYAEVYKGGKPLGETVKKATTPEQAPGKVQEISPDTFWADTVNRIKNGDKYTGLDNLVGQAAAEMKKLDTPFGRSANIILNSLLGSEALSGVKVKVSEKPKAPGNKAVATYDTDTDTITVWNGGAGFTPGIFVHEMMHAATAHKILITSGGIKGKKTQAMVQAYQALSEITKQYIISYGSESFAQRLKAMDTGTATAELVAEAIANERVQNNLKKLQSPLEKRQTYTAKQYSAWNAFVDAVKQLLGLNTGRARTALDELMVHLAPMVRTERNVADIGKSAQLDSLEQATGPAASMGVVDSTLDSIKSAVTKMASVRSSAELKDASLDLALGWMTLNNISRTWGHVFPWLEEYIQTKKKVASMSSELNHASSELDSKWKKWTTSPSGKKIAGIKIDWDGVPNSTVSYAQLAEALQVAMTRFEIDPRLPIEKQKGYSEVKDMSGFLEDYNRVIGMYNELSKIQAGKELLLQKLQMNEELHKRLYEQQLRNVLFTFGTEADKAMAEINEGSTDSIIKELENVILVAGAGGKEAAAVVRQMKKQYESTRGPYFHIGRFGDFYVRYHTGKTVGEDGKEQKGQEYFMRFETREERDEAVRELVSIYGKENVMPGSMDKHLPALDDHSAVFIRSMMQRIEAKQGTGDLYTPEYIAGVKNLIRELHIQMLPETAPDRVYVRRRNVPGYKESQQHRAWAKRVVMANLQLARLSNLIPMQEHMERMTAKVKELHADAAGDQKKLDTAHRAKQILDEIKTRAADEVSSIDTPAWVTTMNQFAYTMFLAASPSYILLNALQPIQLAQPVIAGRHGYVRTAKALAKSTAIGGKILAEMYKGNALRPYIDLWVQKKDKDGNPTTVYELSDAAKRIGLSDLQAKFLQEMLDSGRIDITQAFEIGHTARQDDGPIKSKVAALGIFSHYGEVLNRVAAGLTAFDLELERAGLTNKNLSTAEGSSKLADITAYAARTIEDTQFDYSQMNLARQMGKSGFMGSTTPLAMGFQRYAAQLIELWVRTVDQAFVTKFAYIENKAERESAIKEARRTLMYLLTNTGMIAGTMGLPMATVLFAAASSLAGDDDEPYDAKTQYRVWLAELFGKDAAEIIAKGGFRAAGFDIAQRAGMQDLVPFSRLLADRRRMEDSLNTFAMEAWGPAIGGALQFAAAYDLLQDGHPTMKAMETMLPNFVKGAAKAYQAYDNGYVLDSKGNKIPYKYDGMDITYTALGLNPSEVAEQREKVYSYNTKEQLMNRRKSALIREVQRARESGDSGEIAAAWRAVDEFNAKNPEWRLTRQTVIQSERRRKRDLEAALSSPSQLPDSRRHAKRVEEYAAY